MKFSFFLLYLANNIYIKISLFINRIMDISASNYENIKSYITYSIQNSEYELEALLSKSNKITTEKFKEIFQYFSETDDYELISDFNNESLDIRIVSNKTLEKFRLTIEDKDEIMSYCKKNKYNPNNINYGIKRSLKNYKPIVLNNYPVRFNLKYESNLDDQEDIKSIDNNIAKSKKYFRFKKRFSFITSSKLFRIDLSLVKSSKNSYSTTFYESGILNQSPEYEVEIEFNNDEYDDKVPIEKVMNELFNIIGNVLLIIEDNDYIITNDERDDVKKQYLQLAFNLDKKKVDNLSIYNPKKYFIGVQPVTLELNNLLESDSNSIMENYSVTDKADGERNLLYIHTNNKVYLINNRLKIKYTGLKHKDAKTIIDGEYITNDRFGNDIKKYMAFDIYYHKGKDVSSKPLLTNSKNRMSILQDIIENKENKFISEKKNNTLTINLKEFYFSDGNKLLKKHCKKILDNSTNQNYEYYIDGLIFTPTNLAVGANKEGDPSSLTGTWKKVFKWKPIEDNTIDFLVKFVGEIQEETTKRKYMSCELYVGYDQDLDINPIKILNNDFEDNIYAMKKFGEGCYLEIDLDGNILTKDNKPIEDNMIVEFSYDVDSVKDDMFRWMPYRIRYDKTELYRITKKISGTANDYTTAQNVWNTIQNPVTNEMITGVEEVTKEIVNKSRSDNEVYYNRETSREQSLLKPLLGFHNYWVKNQFLYRRFTGTNSLFEIACGKGGDLHKVAKGKFRLVVGSDINKDNLYNVSDGIYKRYNQLVKKGIIRPNKQKMVFMILDASQEWNKKYINSIDDEFSQRAAKILFNPNGLIKKSDIKKEEKVLLNFYNKAVTDKFNLVSIQFAIHYMFENDTTLNNFVKNVDSVLKVDGYFMGTCLDGFLVSEKLKDKDEIKGEMNNKTLWMIQKKYNEFNKYDKNKPLENVGKQISVYVETINQLIDEYLVDYELLKYKLGQYNIRPLKEVDLKALNLDTSSGSFEDIFNHFSKDKKNKIDEMSQVHKEYSFLNRFFIFKKYSN